MSNQSKKDGPDINPDDNTEFFLKWTVEKYHYGMDWETIRSKFEKTANLVRAIADACVDAENFGSNELKTVCHAANIHLTKSKLQEYIHSCRVPEETKAALASNVPDSFGIVGGPLMGIRVNTDEAETTVLTAFATLLHEESTENELLEAIEAIATADITGVKAGRLTPVLGLLRPKLFPINNGETSTTSGV